MNTLVLTFVAQGFGLRGFPASMLLACLVSLGCAPAVARDSQADSKIERLRDFGESVAKRGCQGGGRTTTRQVTNRHDPKIRDQVEKTVCPDLEIQYYIARVNSPPRRILASMEISGDALLLPFGLKRGATRAEVVGLLGLPDLSTPKSITYFAPQGEAGGSDGVTFSFEGNRLSRFSVGFHFE